MESPLTAADNSELLARPAGSSFAMTDGAFNVRLELAQRACRFFLDNDQNLPGDCRQIYEENPMWAFYVRKADNRPARSVGVAVEEGGISRLHVVVLDGCVRFRRNGLPVSEFKKVYRWDKEHLTQINRSVHPGWFTDPLGFLAAMTPAREHIEANCGLCDECALLV
jgi:hypothetical protein